jgi:tetratricopeptide (TPR) repeat protein
MGAERHANTRVTGDACMSTNRDSSSAGRQLLSVNTRLSTETAPDARESLWKRKVRLLADQGNPSAVMESIDALRRELPGSAQAHLTAADAMSRLGRWDDALASFLEAVRIMKGAGDVDGARKLELGPVYRLYEAFGNHGACIEMAHGSEPIALVLRARAWRRGGAPSSPPMFVGDGRLASALLLLEQSWAGENARLLPATVDDWGRQEPEWRWRVLVEGIQIYREIGFRIEPWRKLHAELSRTPVLDPRFPAERKSTAALLKPQARSGPGGRSSIV